MIITPLGNWSGLAAPVGNRRPVTKGNTLIAMKVIIWWLSIVMWVPQNGWLIRTNPIKMDVLGLPPFMENMGCWHITESASIYIYRLKRPLREWPLVDKLSHCLTNQLGDPTHRDYIQRIPEKCRLVTQDFYGWMLSTWPPWYPDFSTGHTLHQSNIGIEHGGFILGNYLLRVVISHIYVSLWGGNPTKKGGGP